MEEIERLMKKKKALEIYIKQKGTQEEEEEKEDQRRKGRKKGQRISPEVRKLVEKAVLDDLKPWKEVMNTFEISKSSVAKIAKEGEARRKRVLQEQMGGPVSPPPAKKMRVGRKTILDGEDLSILLDLLDAQPGLTLKELRAEFQKMGTTVSEPTISRALADLNVTYKKMTKIPSSWNTPAALRARQDYVLHAVVGLLGRPVVCVDECPFTLHVQQQHGRAVAGEPARLTLPPKRRNLTLIGALSLSGGLFYHQFVQSMEHKRGVNTDDFCLFLCDLLAHLPPRSVILMDNASIHHTPAVEQMVTLLQAHDHRVLYLPPYSPFLNPIEYAFSKIKRIVRHENLREASSLRGAIETAVRQVTQENVTKWYGHMVTFFHQCELGLPFKGKALHPDLLTTCAPALDQLQVWRALVGLPPLLTPTSPHISHALVPFSAVQ